MKYKKIPKEYSKKIEKESESDFCMEFIPPNFDKFLSYIIYKNPEILKYLLIKTFHLEDFIEEGYSCIIEIPLE